MNGRNGYYSSQQQVGNTYPPSQTNYYSSRSMGPYPQQQGIYYNYNPSYGTGFYPSNTYGFFNRPRRYYPEEDIVYSRSCCCAII